MGCAMDNHFYDLLMKKLDDHGNDLKSMRDDLSEVKSDLGHYKGFLGGVTFVFSIAWAGITYFLSNFKGGQNG